MSVTLELPPEIEREVSQAAAARGQTVEAYLLSVIAATAPSRLAQGSLEEFTADLDALAQYSDSIPILSDEAYTRESIYGED